jgi:hypothetical protein
MAKYSFEAWPPGIDDPDTWIRKLLERIDHMKQQVQDNFHRLLAEDDSDALTIDEVVQDATKRIDDLGAYITALQEAREREGESGSLGTPPRHHPDLF